MWKALQHKFMASSADDVPLFLREAQKMQLTIDRLTNTANLNLFKTDYLE
ncbi:hypothetical protein QUG64_01805 [Acinetobacter lwoffii]|jgi:hypothetical protein|uniref:Uncharacterized protein n=1 Tax=Acinetobacter lwoffii NCTC 5866 = CIP 64.10 = NIPH 512 TaxID=981327 RepID=A0ABN0PXA2_ACILW|nr:MULTISPECIES: hypothetical protein [Acinetobacter]ENU17539.1 hypothetical protein F995_01178 [Acinetobacter sp. CIP A162]ESJ95087.1 hypothetical protein P800_01816 [Acinetobacter lwoffii NCTC 5866 = CIP 64.10 = NIPH 512]MCO8063132.1 hypothetical protein [Acinetobacter lwoffii]MCO8073536.1 hypothetical protein [Acinetobacter lwoffii]MCO8076416.1 hypothetical protein [Acinetobacter lwoffii]